MPIGCHGMEDRRLEPLSWKNFHFIQQWCQTNSRHRSSSGNLERSGTELELDLTSIQIREKIICLSAEMDCQSEYNVRISGKETTILSQTADPPTQWILNSPQPWSTKLTILIKKGKLSFCLFFHD